MVTKWVAFVGLFVGMMLIGLIAPGAPSRTPGAARAAAVQVQPASVTLNTPAQ